MDTETIAARSLDRVVERIPDESPLTDTDGRPLCPWCQTPLRVRRTILGRLAEANGRQVCIDGVQMKCAGGGCCYRPDFDVPIAEAEFDEELERRGGERAVDVAYRQPTEVAVEQRLVDLGYLTPE